MRIALLFVFVMLSSVISPALAANTTKMKPIMTTERLDNFLEPRHLAE